LIEYSLFSNMLFLMPILAYASEPPSVNPFAKSTNEQTESIPGCIKLSDDSLHPGMIYLTRDKRLKVYDGQMQREREIQFESIKQIDCIVKKEWVEKEWKFTETTSNEKKFTGQEYPARECEHTITLKDGRTITGYISAIVYLQTQPPSVENDNNSPSSGKNDRKIEKFILYKRQKGEINQTLQSLIYVKSVKLGEVAFQDGLQESGKKTKPKLKQNDPLLP
jgi:hypothetical protein